MADIGELSVPAHLSGYRYSVTPFSVVVSVSLEAHSAELYMVTLLSSRVV
jgi:hypothetical protein